jgi:hypothetical protein
LVTADESVRIFDFVAVPLGHVAHCGIAGKSSCVVAPGKRIEREGEKLQIVGFYERRNIRQRQPMLDCVAGTEVSICLRS